jgi:hypothetical protein
MATTVWGAAGTTLSIDEIVGNSNTFSLINNFTDLDGLFGGTVAAAKTTSLATVNSHTYRGTIRDPDEISGNLWYDPTDAVHKFIRNWNNYPGNGNYTMQVLFNTGNTTSSGTALAAACTTFTPGASDVEANLAAAVTFKISGDTTWVNSV